MGLLTWLTGNAAPERSKPALPPVQLVGTLLALNNEERSWQLRDVRAELPGSIGEVLEQLGLTHRPDLVASWKTERTDVARRLADAGVPAGFTVLLRLDQAALTVRSVDHDGGASIASDGRKSSANLFRGQARVTGASATYRPDGAGEWVATASNVMSTDDIKAPLRRVVRESGWGWRGVGFGRF